MINVWMHELSLKGIPKKSIGGPSERNNSLWHAENEIASDVSCGHTAVQEIDFSLKGFL